MTVTCSGRSVDNIPKVWCPVRAQGGLRPRMAVRPFVHAGSQLSPGREAFVPDLICLEREAELLCGARAEPESADPSPSPPFLLCFTFASENSPILS